VDMRMICLFTGICHRYGSLSLEIWWD